MDPNLEEKQNDQSQEKQSESGISQGINAINNLVGRGLKNPFKGFGTGVAGQTVIKGGFAAFIASPAGLPILIALTAIVVLTVFIIVGLGGIPGAPTQEPALPPTPTETPTPAPPAAP